VRPKRRDRERTRRRDAGCRWLRRFHDGRHVDDQRDRIASERFAIDELPHEWVPVEWLPVEWIAIDRIEELGRLEQRLVDERIGRDHGLVLERIDDVVDVDRNGLPGLWRSVHDVRERPVLPSLVQL
jgi:hypothetical protein